MKMKKILSMGAVALVLACSTSVGAFAAERPTNKDIKEDIITAFLKGDRVLEGYAVTSKTAVNDLVNTTQLKKDATNASENFGITTNLKNLNDALDCVKPEKTVKENVATIYLKFSGEGRLDDLVEEVREVAQELRDIENTDSDNKVKIETEIKTLIERNDLKVNFGRNINGLITMSVMRNDKVVVQLTSANAYTISKALGSATDSKIKADAALAGLTK